MAHLPDNQSALQSPPCPDKMLPLPGTVIHQDFRPDRQSAEVEPSTPIRLVQWNIERGYKLSAIIQQLREIDADVLSIQVRVHAQQQLGRGTRQVNWWIVLWCNTTPLHSFMLKEVDIGCERSDSIDTGTAIASALSLNYIFVCEFEELHSPLREAHVQGGGVHGRSLVNGGSLAE